MVRTLKHLKEIQEFSWDMKPYYNGYYWLSTWVYLEWSTIQNWRAHLWSRSWGWETQVFDLDLGMKILGHSGYESQESKAVMMVFSSIFFLLSSYNFFKHVFKMFFHGLSPYCMPCVHRCPNRPPEGIWSFITGVGSYCGTSDIGSRKESSPLEEIQMLLTFESSLRTSVFFLI